MAAEPLTPEAWAPFGELVAAARGDVAGRPANQGTAQRFNHLARVENLRGEGAPLNLCAFRVSPVTALPFEVRLLEKHPLSTQVFIPMNARRYLVIVAPGEDAPDLGELRAFLALGTQGISYRPGTWHHPLLGLDAEADFACLVHEDQTAADCVTWELPPEARLRVALTSG